MHVPVPAARPQARIKFRDEYVALTRARRDVTLITVRGEVSPFVHELVAGGALRLVDVGAGADGTVPCPACRRGTFVERTGPYGRFLGCSAFPRCRFTREHADASVRTP